MIQLNINGNLVIFTKFFNPTDFEEVRKALYSVEYCERVVFIDTPATKWLVEAVSEFNWGIEVIVRDHHDVEGTDEEVKSRGGRDWQIRQSANEIRQLLGDCATISNRSEHPSCAQLIEEGEFGGSSTVLIADTDLDGLTAVMKAAGVTYPGLDEDAAVLDSGRALQTEENLTSNGFLLTRAMAALPPYDRNHPEVAERAKAGLFKDFIALVEGRRAKERLEERAKAHEAKVLEAERVAATAEEVIPSVWLVDTRDAKRFDVGAFDRAMVRRRGCQVIVQLQSFGVVAKNHGGEQFFLSVPRDHQRQINLQHLLPKNFESSPEAGIISNNSFMLRVSRSVWEEWVFPALQNRFLAGKAERVNEVVHDWFEVWGLDHQDVIFGERIPLFKRFAAWMNDEGNSIVYAELGERFPGSNCLPREIVRYAYETQHCEFWETSELIRQFMCSERFVAKVPDWVFKVDSRDL